MNQTERVIYTLKGYKFKEISKAKGSIEYQLTDELGNERLVTAMAKLNWRGQIHRVRPIYHRESPLIQALANTALEDTLVVDFSEFNKKHPRGSMRKQKVSVPSFKVKGLDKQPITDISSIFENKSRLLNLFVLGSIGFIGLAYLLSKFPL